MTLDRNTARAQLARLPRNAVPRWRGLIAEESDAKAEAEAAADMLAAGMIPAPLLAAYRDYVRTLRPEWTPNADTMPRVLIDDPDYGDGAAALAQAAEHASPCSHHPLDCTCHGCDGCDWEGWV